MTITRLFIHSHWINVSLYIIAVLFLPVASLKAQRIPKAEALTIEDGLGFRDVTSIAQDKQGLMWFGTRQGLNRYDGYQFTTFTKDQNNGSFPGEVIWLDAMFFSDDSLMWMIIDKRLYTFNRNTFKTHLISDNAGVTGDVIQLKKSRNGDIWIVSENTVEQFLSCSKNKSSFQQVAIVERIRREFTNLAIDTSGNAWWSTITHGIQQYTPDGKLLLEMMPDSFNWFGTKMYFTPVKIDRENRIFIFPKSKYEIWQYHPEDHRIEVIRDDLPGTVFNAMEDSQGNTWFTTKTQLFRRSPDNTWIDYSQEIKSALQFTSIQQLYEDQSNLLWIATDNGLLKIPIQKQLFHISASVPGEAWGNAMRGIFEDGSDQIYSYCENGEIGIHKVYPASETPNEILFSGTSQDLAHNIIGGAKHFIYDHDANMVWTLTDKLLKIDLTKKSIVQSIDFSENADAFFHNPIIKLSDGHFLIGFNLENMITYDPMTHEKKKLLKESDPHFQYVSTDYFLENKDRSVWVGTDEDGLYRIDMNGEIVQHLTTDTRPALSNNHILVLQFDHDSLLWIGTFGGGLNCLDMHNDSIKIFTQKEGLPNNNVTGILTDDDGNIWASTYNGLSCYRKKEGSFENYYEEDGLSTNEFNYISFFRDHKGMLWFGGMNGVQYFDPKEILQNRANPSLSFTGFVKYNRLRDSLESHVLGDHVLAPVIISPYDSYFQFSWTLPNYFKPDKNRYYVWLEGLENDWTYVGNIPMVRYHKLPSGNYTLHIKGADSKGNWSADELSVRIHVRPFFYTTWWFLLICSMVIAVMVYAFTRYRLQRLLEMERMRTRIAGDLHDEVGSMLSGLAMQAEILEMDQNKSDPARLRRISDISRLTLSKMRDVVWSIDSRRDQVKNLLDRMREHAEEMLTPKEIGVHFQLGELDLNKKLTVDDRQNLFLFFKEAITNIVKHSDADSVNICFGQFDDHFELSIHDNGKTTIPNHNSTGLGLQNMEMRAEKLGATFRINHQDGFQVSMRRKSL